MKIIAKAAVVAVAVIAVTHADAQRYRRRPPREAKPPPVSVDSRDSIVAAGAFAGRPYWLALARCGGIYFKLNMLYTQAAVRARVITPNPHANAVYTKKLNEAINIATTYFDAAENFLRSNRGLGHDDAILTYAPQSQAAGDQVKTIEGALAAADACPALYRACKAAHPKICSEPLAPLDRARASAG